MSKTEDAASYIVRPYRAEGGRDRLGIREVFRLTGLFGDPVERYFPAPDFIADAMVEYYLRFEPDWAFVAEDVLTRQVIGYITGCPDSGRRREGQTRRQPMGLGHVIGAALGQVDSGL